MTNRKIFCKSGPTGLSHAAGAGRRAYAGGGSAATLPAAPSSRLRLRRSATLRPAGSSRTLSVHRRRTVRRLPGRPLSVPAAPPGHSRRRRRLGLPPTHRLGAGRVRVRLAVSQHWPAGGRHVRLLARSGAFSPMLSKPLRVPQWLVIQERRKQFDFAPILFPPFPSPPPPLLLPFPSLYPLPSLRSRPLKYS